MERTAVVGQRASIPGRGDQMPWLSGPTPEGSTLRTRSYYMRRNLALVFTGEGDDAQDWAAEAASVRPAARDEAEEKACAHNRMLINSAVERYAVTTGADPSSLDDLNTPDYFPEGIPVCPVSGNPYTLNPATQRVNGHTPGAH